VVVVEPKPRQDAQIRWSAAGNDLRPGIKVRGTFLEGTSRSYVLSGK